MSTTSYWRGGEMCEGVAEEQKSQGGWPGGRRFNSWGGSDDGLAVGFVARYTKWWQPLSPDSFPRPLIARKSRRSKSCLIYDCDYVSRLLGFAEDWLGQLQLPRMFPTLRNCLGMCRCWSQLLRWRWLVPPPVADRLRRRSPKHFLGK